jgi:glucan biosynthesis protein C
LILPIVWLSAILDPRTGLGQRNFGGWPLPVYICYLLYGFILFSHARLQARIQQMRWFYLVAALATATVLLFQFGYALPRAGTKAQLYFGLFFIISSWCWILAFIGFTSKYLTSNTRLLKYANEAVLPFFIMHQTVLLVIGYFVLRWPIPDPGKWLVIALSSFVLVMGIYELLVRRFNVLRVLFGMKPMAKQPAVRVPGPVPAR